MKKLLRIRDLDVFYHSYRGMVRAVRDAYLEVNSKQMVGLIGETGCGKSTLGLAIVRLVPTPGKIEKGEIFFEGEDLLKKGKDDMTKIRRDKISMIFQDPSASLNPLFRAGYQIAESVMISKNLRKSEAMEEAINLLSVVRIADPEKVARQYPHELSGGMKQRVMIAIALSADPKLLIADEPTSSLDVTIQAQILELISKIKEETGMSILLITHDMGIVAQTCDKVVVMYAGDVVEIGSITDIFKRSAHPYTKGLLDTADLRREKRRLNVIPGVCPDLIEPIEGCIFHPRCHCVQEVCRKKRPELLEIEPGHLMACHLLSE